MLETVKIMSLTNKFGFTVTKKKSRPPSMMSEEDRKQVDWMDSSPLPPGDLTVRSVTVTQCANGDVKREVRYNPDKKGRTEDSRNRFTFYHKAYALQIVKKSGITAAARAMKVDDRTVRGWTAVADSIVDAVQRGQGHLLALQPLRVYADLSKQLFANYLSVRELYGAVTQRMLMEWGDKLDPNFKSLSVRAKFKVLHRWREHVGIALRRGSRTQMIPKNHVELIADFHKRLAAMHVAKNYDCILVGDETFVLHDPIAHSTCAGRGEQQVKIKTSDAKGGATVFLTALWERSNNVVSQLRPFCIFAGQPLKTIANRLAKAQAGHQCNTYCTESGLAK